ncbi:MAG TPA: GNAT family N-acetyltransferase [Aestuariivirga sp.]|nr:GNAT family N-acetyltransferase [Aestuariivirga sp.]
MKDIMIRDAVEGDARALAEVCVMAGHGVMELFYEGLVPGKSVIDCVMTRRILDRDSFATFRRWRVATDGAGQILGAMNSLPHKALMSAPDDPLLDEAKMRPIAALLELEEIPLGSYYVNIIAVYPQHRRSGAGAALMRDAEHLARVQKFSRMSLCTFEDDPGLMGFYRGQGFEPQARRAIVPHPAIGKSGHFVLMTRALQ